MAMKGAIVHWVQWWLGRFSCMTWQDLTVEFLDRFGEDSMFKPFEALVVTTHISSMDDYVDTFILRLAHVYGFSDSLCLGLLLDGLREDIETIQLAHDMSPNSD